MNPDPNTCIHLTPTQILEIHEAAIRLFGGSPGLRDWALLESAAAAPKATFGGTSTFSDTVEVAAAYLYYLCGNHPFNDGNKRVALGACIVFLELNGYIPAPDGEPWENLTLAVAAGLLNRAEVTAALRELLDAPAEPTTPEPP